MFEFFGEFREIEIQIVRRECGGMREEECIGGEAERRFFWKRFLFEDIQDGSADFPGAQKRDERIFVDQVSATVVMEDGRRFEKRETGCVEQVCGIGIGWNDSNDMVGFGEEGIELSERCDGIGRAQEGWCGMRGARDADDSALEREEHLCKGFSDSTEAEDENGLGGEAACDSGVGVARPGIGIGIAVHEGVERKETAGKAEDGGEGCFSDDGAVEMSVMQPCARRWRDMEIVASGGGCEQIEEVGGVRDPILPNGPDGGGACGGKALEKFRFR